MAAQVTSPQPWGQYHDLRWLLVFHYSWFGLVLEALFLLVARSGLDAAILRAGWPQPAPGWRSLFTRGIGYTAVVWLFLLPWTLLGFAMGVVPISWLYFTTVPPVFVVALACSRGAGRPGWWRLAPPRRAVSTAAWVFGGQTIVSLATSVAPAPLWLPIAAVAGGFNGWAWRRVIGAVAAEDEERRRIPVAPLASVGMFVVAVSGAAIAFAVVGSRRPPAGPPAEATGSGSEPAVLVVSGFDSKLNRSTPVPPIQGGRVVRFSYRGLDERGNPLPYAAADTHRSIADLAALLGRQVAVLHAETHKPVRVVAESEGSLIAEVYATADPRAPLSKVILLSPLVEPGRVYYPDSGSAGFGAGSGAGLQAITDLLGAISPVHLPADSPFLRSIEDHAALLRGLIDCPAPVPEVFLEPLADSLGDPSPPHPPAPAVVIPAFHGGLLTNREAQHDIDRLLAGERVRTTTGLGTLETVLRGGGAGWDVPSLPLAVYGPSPDHPSCAAIARGIRNWIPLRGPAG